MWWWFGILAANASPDVEAAVRDAVARGDCEAALQQAEAHREAASDDPLGPKLVGDGLRCSGRNVAAVRQYRQAIALGGTDPTLTRLVQTLEKMAVTARIRVEGVDPELGKPDLHVLVGDEAIAPYAVAFPEYRFRDLPPDQLLVVGIGGAGYEARTVSLGSFGKGETAEHELPLEQRPPAMLVLPEWTAAAQVALVLGRERRMLSAGSHPVTAGEVVVEVISESGAIRETFTLAQGERHELDVDELVPGVLSIVGLPAGATWHVEGPTSTAPSVTSPRGEGTDPVHGVVVLPAQRVEGLRTGDYSVVVEHPVMGVARAPTLVIGGELSTLRIDLASFDRAAPLADAYADWRQLAAAAETPPSLPKRTWVGAGTAGGGAALVGLGIATWLATEGRVEGARADYQARIDEGDYVGAREQYEAIGRARNGFVLPVGLIGVGAAGLGVGGWLVVDGLGSRPPRAKVPPWDPSSALGGAR